MDTRIACFPSCDLAEKYKGRSIVPHIKIFGVSGFHKNKVKFITDPKKRLPCYGELRLAWCLTRVYECIENRKYGPWNWLEPTRNMQLDPIPFNQSFESFIPYQNFYDVSGICFVVCSTYTNDKGVQDHFLAGCHLYCYNNKMIFRNGIYELLLHPLEGYKLNNLTDCLNCIVDNNMDGKPRKFKELNNLCKDVRKHLRGEFRTALSIDKLTSTVVPARIEELKRETGEMFLSVKFEFSRELPFLHIPVMFMYRDDGNIVDRSMERRNLYDEMYICMTRNVLAIEDDKKRTPGPESLFTLENLIENGFGKPLSENDGDLIWRYRFYLAKKFPTALARFLLSVRWEYATQAAQVMELLRDWPTVEPEVVLELFTRPFSSVHRVCRLFAVSRLQQASDDEIELYLYQLVQALRYESHKEVLAQEAISALDIEEDIAEGLARVKLEGAAAGSSTAATKLPVQNGDELPWKKDLATFLIERACSNFKIANYLYWFLSLEIDVETSNSTEARQIFDHVLKRFKAALEMGTTKHQKWHSDLTHQRDFVDGLYNLMRAIQNESTQRTKKIELLRKYIKERIPLLTSMDHPVPFPMNPDFLIAGIDEKTATLFKSTTQPALLDLVSTQGDIYRVVFKIGDDLRQDQLVLQMIRLMDVILQKEKFDLHLTPYNVLAASCRHGFIQFVDSVPLSDTKQQGSIQNYLKSIAPDASQPSGINAEVLETYILSCAGYCVITYLLGVGDRHMDNIMLTRRGRLFHIDFSYFLGNDPKVMAPEVRLNRAMIEAMGGVKGAGFEYFLKNCLTAFISLRRRAHLFLTMLTLVQDTGVRDMARDPQKAVEFVRERLCLGQSDEVATSRFATALSDSMRAVMPDVMEGIHSVLQYFRS